MEGISYTTVCSEQQSIQLSEDVADKQKDVQEIVPVSAYRSTSAPRTEKIQKLLEDQIVNLEALRELAWSGIPPMLRPLCWRLLLGYVPPNKELRGQVLARKRKEYKNLVMDYYNHVASNQERTVASGVLHSHDEDNALRQVAVDVPRTAPEVPFFHQPRIQKSLERILFIWGIRHPASGYVQGINDLATPFLAAFTSERMKDDTNIEDWNVEILDNNDILDIEADSYWCLCKLLDGIQDHYTYAQPGIQKTLFHVGELISRVEGSVAEHLAGEGVEYMQFAFRWVNCLLLREIPFELGIRLWDTYLSEGSALKGFLVYVLSSFLLSWAPELKKMEFQEIIMFLQHCPTKQWTERDIELVLSRAFMWRTSFKDASSHFA
jgi:TBC1 domain family member 2